MRGEVGRVQEDRYTTGTTVVPRDVLAVAKEAALSAGAELTARYGRPAEGLGAKAHPTDLVSDADRAAEAAIAAVLARRRPDDGILGEEGTANREGTTGLRWVVDPLDGTVNYLSGIPLWCVSIACEDAVGTLAGVVHDPLRGHTYAAVRGGRAPRRSRPPRPDRRPRRGRSGAPWRPGPRPGARSGRSARRPH